MRPIIEQMTKSGGAVLLDSAAPATGAAKGNGHAANSSGKKHATSAGAAVPATAEIRQGLAFTPAGALYVTDTVPAASAVKHQGFAIRADGALHVNSGAPGSISFAGVSVDSTGRLYESGV